MASIIDDIMQAAQASSENQINAAKDNPSPLVKDILSEDPLPKVNASLDHGSKINPAHASRVLKARDKTGLAEDLVSRNIDDIERQDRATSVNSADLAKTSPGVSEWLSESPNNSAAGYEDLTNLNYMELQLRNIKNKFNEGRLTMELSDIGEAAFIGNATPEQRKRQKEIQDILSRPEDLGIDGFFEGIPSAVANQLPILAKVISGQAKGAVAGAVAGSVLPGTGTRAGAAAGWRIGAGVQAARMEGALAYLDYENLLDAKGKPIDPDVARGAAAIVGVLNGSLEFIGFESLAKTIPGLKNFQRNGVKKILKNPAIQHRFMSIAKDIGQAMGTEGVTEFLQEMVTSAGSEISQMLQDGKPFDISEMFSRILSKQNLSAAVQSGKMGAQAGFGISASGITASEVLRMRQSKRKAEQIKQTGDVIESMKLTQSNPETVEKIIDKVVPEENIYIPAESFVSYFQSQGIDPKEVASEVMKNPEQLDEALNSGQDIVVPAAKYYTSKMLGGGEHKEFFSSEVRTDPMDMNAREWEEEATRLDEEHQAMQDQQAQENPVVQENVVNISDNISSQLQESGFDKKTADTYAKLYEATFTNLGERTGQQALDLFEKFRPEINKLDSDQTETFLQKARNGLKNFFQKDIEFPDTSNYEIMKTNDEFYEAFSYDSKGRRKQIGGLSLIKDDKGDYYPSSVYVRDEFQRQGIATSLYRMAEQHLEKQIQPSRSLSRDGLNFWLSFRPKSIKNDLRLIENYLLGKNVKFNYGGNIYEGKIETVGARETSVRFDLEDRKNLLVGANISNLIENNKDNVELQRVLADPLKVYQANQEKAFKNIFLQNDNDAKGAFRIGNGTFNIDLLKDADLSTFLHETGHLFLEVFGEVSASTEQTQQDYKTLLDWFGVESRDQITTEHHEQFARGFEAYLMEGKAPSSSLRKIFAKFKVWLIQVYKNIKNLNVDLTDEVRGVFDRLVATDEQIAEIEGELNISPLFEDTSILGEEKATKYENALEKYRQNVAEKATKQMMEDYRKSEKQWYKNELENQRNKAKQDLFQDKAYVARYALQKGTYPDGTPYPENVLPPKLNRKAVEDMIGKESTKNLPRGIFSKEGEHPEVLASLFNFRSGQDFLIALARTENPKDIIERQANQKMKELYPDLQDQKEAFKQEVLASMHNDARSEILRFELKWLANEAPAVLKEAVRQVSRRVPSNKDVKAYAKDTIGKQSISKIRPSVYLRAETKSAKEAGMHLAKGDLASAFESKRHELINHELYKQAIEAKNDIEKSLKRFRKISRADKKLAKSRDVDLINAARSILSNYSIGYERKSAASFLDTLKDYDSEAYDTIYSLVEAANENGVDYRSLSYDNFIDLKNTVDALWDLSRSSKLVEIDGQKEDRDEVIAKLAGRIDKISKPKEMKKYNSTKSTWEKTQMYLLGVKSALRRVESWVSAIDGENGDGLFRKYIWNPISESGSAYRIQKKEYILKYLEITKMIEKELKHTKDINADEIGFKFKGKKELLGAMLHTGNQSNLQKLLRGRNWANFNEDNILETSKWDSFVKRMWDEGTLTKNDYDFLQATWDLLEELKPEAQKAHKKIYGYFFNEVIAQEFETPFGKYRGGYVPAVIDPFETVDQEIRLDREELEKKNNSFMFPTTGRGFSKTRSEAYAAPLQIDLSFIPGHIDKVLRFSNIEPHIKDVAKIVMNKSFRDILNQLDSGVAKNMLIPWLQRSARQQVEIASQSRAGKAADMFFRYLRRTTGMNIMFANASNTLQQFTGLSIAAIKVKPKYLRNAMWKYARNPKKLTAIVNEKSEFMNTRTTTNVIEIMNTLDEILLNPNQYQKARDFSKKHAYFFQAGAQNIVDVITWSGKYDEAVEADATEKEAIRQADAAVRETQGSFNPEDISKFESGSAFVRSFTMFYSYFNMQVNLLGSEFVNISRDIGLKKGAGRALYAYVLGFMIPAFVSELIVRALSGSYDEDDDDNYLDDTMAYFFGGQFRTATAMFPVIGPTIQATVNHFNDKWYDDRISTSPAISMIESATSAPQSVYKAITENGSKKKAVRDLLSAVGLMSGLPIVPLSRPIGYLLDVKDRKAEPTGPIDFVRGIVTGRSGNK